MKNATTQTQKAIKTINLIDGCFTTAEAADVLHALLDKKINFHKLQRLSVKEGNENDECVYDNGRIAELIQAKKDLKTYLLDIKGTGQRLKIASKVEITIED